MGCRPACAGLAASLCSIYRSVALTAGWKFPSWGKTVLGPVRENMTGEMAGGNALHSEIE